MALLIPSLDFWTLLRIHFVTVYRPITTMWDILHQCYQSQPKLIDFLCSVLDNPIAHPNHTVKDGIILYKGRALVPTEIAL